MRAAIILSGVVGLVMGSDDELFDDQVWGRMMEILGKIVQV